MDSNGALVSGAFRIERPVIIAAGTRFYPAGQWSISGPGSVSFAWDDSILPLDAYPYTIDPALPWPETGFVGNDAWPWMAVPSTG